MSIKMRRGKKANLDTSRLVGGEFAITDDPEEIYVKTNDGVVVRLATQDDLNNLIMHENIVTVRGETLVFKPKED